MTPEEQERARKARLQSVVTLINVSPRYTMVDAWDGVFYKIGPKSKIDVPEYVARHWLGDPTVDPDEWGNEVVRISYRNPGLFHELLNGHLYVKQWRATGAEKHYSVDLVTQSIEGRAMIESIPLDESEITAPSEILDHEEASIAPF